MPLSTAVRVALRRSRAASSPVPGIVAGSMGSPNQKYRRSGRGIIGPRPTLSGGIGIPTRRRISREARPRIGVSSSATTSNMSSTPMAANGTIG